MSKYWLRATVLFAFVSVFVFSLPAQVQNGQFAGTVLDQSGAAVPNAKITVKNQATGLTQTVTSNQTGSYVVREVPPGLYSLTAQAQGFKTSTLANMNVNAGNIQRADFHLEVGQVSQTVEVSGAAPPVNTEDSKLSTTVSSTQISNLPLNGRNVYDLMQLAPGAVNVTGVDFEAGHMTVVNGLREDFNGFMINGVSNKDLSGGAVNVPIQDTVQEFQQLQLNVSAQYGSSAGSINNLITKSGTNNFHGNVWEYVRNDKFDANQYFLNQQGVKKPPLRFNQFGGTIGGPIIKDKLFFYGAYQGDRFKTVGVPQTLIVESPQWEQAVIAGAPNSVASLLYKNFPPAVAGTPNITLTQYMAGLSGSASSSYPHGFGDLLCPSFWTNTFGTQFTGIAARLAPIVGVQASDYAGSGCADPLPVQAGTMNRNAPFENSTVAVFGTQTQTLGNLFNGNEANGRLDYNWNSSNRMYLSVNWVHETDQFGPCYSYCTRGFTNPSSDYFPNGQFSFIHTFSPSVLNEIRLGYTQNNTGIKVAKPGVPSATILDGTASFGSYSGYPQFFKDHEYSYGDMVSINHGNHNIKVGGELRRNLENSEFNVARPSYLFNDPFQFAADAPGFEAAGVNPGFVSGTGQGQLETNVRHWRNWEIGAYVQDDWKATRRLTLNLGLRWDLYTRHTEENNLATTFKLGPGDGIISQLANANQPLGTGTCNPANPSTVILAGVCGPGGFAPTSRLGPNHFRDFGPRVGFAYDVFGNGKTSLRGGFGVSYEGTLYNPLSNSRWNPPYYSFDETSNALLPITTSLGNVVYGPSTCAAGACSTIPGVAPTFLGAGNNIGIGTIGAQATGNINGWFPGNLDQANLTGVVLPSGVLDPYVMNEFLSVQHEIAPRTVLEVDYVGTLGRRLFRAEQINRAPGGVLPIGSCITNNIGEHLCGRSDAVLPDGTANPASINPNGVPNPNYGKLRTWENVVNSAYNALQVSVRRQMSHGILLNANYTWSHSLDDGSTWHSGATTSNGAAAGEGYTTDQINPHLDWGNSIFDIRHRLVLNYVIQLPGQHLHGVLGAIAGGWAYNGIWSFQSGAHWEPYAGDNLGSAALVNAAGNPCSAADVNSGNCMNTGGDYNLDFGLNDRPNSSSPSLNANRNTWANGWCPGGTFQTYGCASGTTPSQAGLPVLSAPCLGCVGNLRRNQFLGPGQWYSDMGLSKTFKFTERVNLKFEWQAFNVFNRANFLLAVNGGGAHNQLGDAAFGQAAGTLISRN
ncbi:MAG TPA: TonB-dependent receptor, partial [Candidatus Sulfotelmatobacter sp.]|nr:TonB-dependent receptor [Candidatus Sulfotelmatobacter sp.]